MDSSLPHKQCIFLRYFRIRFRVGPITFFANAGPHQLPSHRDDDAAIGNAGASVSITLLVVVVHSPTKF